MKNNLQKSCIIQNYAINLQSYLRTKLIIKMRITKKYLKLIKKNQALVADLVAATGKSYPTIMRWLDNNSEQLTSAACLDVICQSLKVDRETILEKITA